MENGQIGSVFEVLFSAPDGAGSRKRFHKPRIVEVKFSVSRENGKTIAVVPLDKYVAPSKYTFPGILTLKDVVNSLVNNWGYFETAKQAKDAVNVIEQ